MSNDLGLSGRNGRMRSYKIDMTAGKARRRFHASGVPSSVPIQLDDSGTFRIDVTEASLTQSVTLGYDSSTGKPTVIKPKSFFNNCCN